MLKIVGRNALAITSSVEQTFCVDFISRLAAKVGWEHYMLGFCPQSQDYPQGFVYYATGLILVE